MALTSTQFQELLAKAKRAAVQRKNEDEEAALQTIEETIDREQPESIDASATGITEDNYQTEEAQEIITEVAESTNASVRFTKRDVGVARDVSLNPKQQLFIDSALSGEDVVLIGAAGTGKTTVTGKFVKALIDSGKLLPLGVDTKWLRNNVPGVLITSFTRKAVNNIRHAVPEELKQHVLTMHKVLEFAPMFYDIVDPNNPAMLKKTMKFEPQRHKLNPLPSSLTLVIYEESSMIGTTLYNLMMDAMPHQPQEIFIGDIRQLPPIFGPAILGFKMSFLPIIELTEVYRQALLSPIIRLAHAVLGGDSTRFSPKIEVVKEKHAHLNQIVEKKHVPSLEKFEESGPHGSVKIQIWQKKIDNEAACNTMVKQFEVWKGKGYYKPEDDLILCPFNKSFGTVELNKGIMQFLGRQRNAVVHEIVAGFDKHYFAEGDRVLYDKEDAFITRIRRNVSYMGVGTKPPSPFLDRWGTYQKELTEEDMKKAEQEDEEFSLAAVDKFMESFETGEEEERTKVASHVIDIQYAYSEDTETLSSAGEVNALLGGYAITIHKAQGSEANSVFLVLHHSHSMMVNNELLYTAITRAKNKLHIICEIDTFFKGVKIQKVRGVSLQEKIEFFKGKVEFKEMEEEIRMLKLMKERKRRQLEEEKMKREAAEKAVKEKEEEEEDKEYESPRLDDLVDNASTGVRCVVRPDEIRCLAPEITKLPKTKLPETPKLSEGESRRLAMIERLKSLKR